MCISCSPSINSVVYIYIYIYYIIVYLITCVLIDIKIKLNSLAIGYINRDYCPSPEELLIAWDRSGHRRIAVAFT